MPKAPRCKGINSDKSKCKKYDMSGWCHTHRHQNTNNVLSKEIEKELDNQVVPTTLEITDDLNDVFHEIVENAEIENTETVPVENVEIVPVENAELENTEIVPVENAELENTEIVPVENAELENT